LNKNIRKRDLVKIAIENQEIFRRLENKKSEYNIRLLQKNREISEKYLMNISEYPLLLKSSSEFERINIKTEVFIDFLMNFIDFLMNFIDFY